MQKEIFNKDNRFDIDLARGELAELELVKLMMGTKLEVKRDFMAHKTGNVAIEFMSRGKLSGISVSESSHYAIMTDNVTIIIEVERLKEICREWYKEHGFVVGGDDNTSRIVLLPTSKLL